MNVHNVSFDFEIGYGALAQRRFFHFGKIALSNERVYAFGSVDHLRHIKVGRR
jgi:hypothetical protein